VTVALMWEARAPDDQGAALLAWARQQELSPSPVRRETFSAPEDRVLVITWWDAAYEADLPELPAPPSRLTRRPPHRWRFESLDVD
jgi:hypothetical protein